MGHEQKFAEQNKMLEALMNNTAVQQLQSMYWGKQEVGLMFI
jgi:hypothetical protein